MKRRIPKPITVLTPSQLKLLIEAARQASLQDEICLRLNSQAGLRGSEVEQVTPAMFDPAGGVVHAPQVVTAFGRPGYVPSYRPTTLQGSFQALMKSVTLTARHSPICPGKDWSRRLARIGKEAGVQVSSGTLRTSYAHYRFAQTRDCDLGPSLQTTWHRFPLRASALDAAAWFYA